MLHDAFGKQSARAPGSRANALLAVIEAERPDLADQPAVISSQGNTSHTIIFENEVFKGPKQADQIADFEQECRVLQHIGDKGLLVPSITTVGKSAYFYGMTRSSGVHFTRTLMESLPADQQRQAAHDIALFQHRFAQSFSDDDVERLIPDRLGKSPSMTALYDALQDRGVQSALRDRMPSVHRFVDEYAKRLARVEDVVVFGDMHAGNILFDAQAGRISGFIDFGSVFQAVPDAAFSSMGLLYGAGFTAMVCEEYSAISGQKVTYRDAQLCGMGYYLQMLHSALQTNNESGVVAMKGLLALSVDSLRAPVMLEAPMQQHPFKNKI